MHFLTRSLQPVAPEPSHEQELDKDSKVVMDPSYTLQGQMSDLPSAKASLDDNAKGGDGIGVGGSGGGVGGLGFEVLRAKTHMVIEDHSDVSLEEGAILIPCKELPEDWLKAPDLDSIACLDRGFVFPGEQLHILVYISSHDQEATEIITPFKVAAVMSKNGFLKQKNSKRKSNIEPETKSASYGENTDDIGMKNGRIGGSGENAASTLKNQIVIGRDISFSASLLRMEGHKKRSATILESFRNSHFLVRIARTDTPLWGKKNAAGLFTDSSELVNGKDTSDGLEVPKSTQRHNCLSAVIEGGKFDPSSAGGVARNTVTCCSLSNGDIVIVLHVTVATDITEDAILEVLQFEKYKTSSLSSTANVGEKSSQLHQENIKDSHDPCKELLQWLLPLDRPLPPLVPLSPPSLSSSSSFSSNSNQRPPSSGTSASTFFSFGHHRSNSTSSLPQSIPSSTPILSPSNSSSNFGLEDWDRLASQKLVKAQEVGSEGLLSFRGASLEPQRFSVHCGLEGLYVPGKRWRRKLEIVQPVEVDSYFADCNSEDLICVLIKNIVPAHLPDVVIFVDSISIICEAAASGSPPVSVPIACIEVGDEHSLPGLALRRGEQHCLILKPTTSMWKSIGTERYKIPPGAQGRYSQVPGNAASSRNAFSRNNDGKRKIVESEQLESGHYAVLVSCRCSHTESRLYFKHSTQWQPRTPRDLLISVESEMSTPAIGSDGSIPQLSAQVLTLQATNLTADDLSLTVLAPGSMPSLPSVVPMNSTPTTPCMSSFMNFSEGKGRPGALDTEDSGITTLTRLQSTSLPSVRPTESLTGIRPLVLKEQNISAADIMADSSSACTHLWLQSTVPLGCVPSHSTTTVRLELLPLTDGIITLDTLQIAAKDRGIIYVPEKPLKIYSTSSIASGII